MKKFKVSFNMSGFEYIDADDENEARELFEKGCLYTPFDGTEQNITSVEELEEDE